MTEKEVSGKTKSQEGSGSFPRASFTHALFSSESHGGRMPCIMGILNVTPDSFSDGGKWNTRDKALQRAEELIAEGADILDVGCESTRPGYHVVPAAEEAEKLAKITSDIRRNFDIPISVDTYKPEAFLAAAGAGADILNDIWGLRAPEELLREAGCKPGLPMVEMLKKTGCAAVLMHQDLLPRSAEERTEEVIEKSGVSPEGLSDLVVRIREGWEKSLALSDAAGIPRKRLLLDPGVGFSKTQEENLACLSRMDELIRCAEELGTGFLLGVSRKSVIGNILQVPPEERDFGTVAVSIRAMDLGAGVLRVHNVKATREALMIWERMMAGR